MTEPSTIQQFLGRLRQYVAQEDRGALADLRHGFSPGTEYRAWPYVAQMCRLDNDAQRKIWITIGAGFATHKATHSHAGNMGTTLRAIALNQPSESKDKALKSFDARFRRLLTCDNAMELCDHLRGIIVAAERKSVPIDFERLFWDLQTWHKPESKVKLHWAQSYWGQSESKGGETTHDSDSDQAA